MPNEIFSLIVLVLTLAIHISCSTYVYAYATYYQNNVEKHLVLINKPLWVLVVFLGGLVTGTVFFILHGTTLNPHIYSKARRP